MKRYKQILLVIMIFILAVSLSGCIIIPVSKYYDIPAEEVESIQFYDLRSEESKRQPGFDKTYDPVYTLTEKEHEDFLSDFSNIKFSDTIPIVLAAVDPSFSYGEWVIRINYINGDYTFYSCEGYGETFDSKGNSMSSTHFSCEFEDIENLIGKYYKIK